MFFIFFISKGYYPPLNAKIAYIGGQINISQWRYTSMPQHVELGFDKIKGDFLMPLLHAESNKSFRNLILILVLVFKVLLSSNH